MIFVLRFLLFVFYRLRYHGRKHVPKTGSVLFVANHQSNVDPAIVGVFVNDRPFKAIAKEATVYIKMVIRIYEWIWCNFY